VLDLLFLHHKQCSAVGPMIHYTFCGRLMNATLSTDPCPSVLHGSLRYEQIPNCLPLCYSVTADGHRSSSLHTFTALY